MDGIKIGIEINKHSDIMMTGYLTVNNGKKEPRTYI